jgi:hypothetical protein
MRQSKLSRLMAGVFFLFLIASSTTNTNAQTVSTGTVLGTVTDATGGVVADATVVLHNKATNSQANQQTNSAGQYTFPSVTPGEYRIMVKKEGFRAANVESLIVDVAKSFTVDIKLEIGQVSETVTVTTEARVEMQTTTAAVGNVVGGTTLVRLPTLQRDAAELLTLQPGTTPYDTPANGNFGNNGGTVAGARSDQNSISLDGIDITDNTIGGGANAVNFIPTGVESLDEFKVDVTNENATFGRSLGGQVSLVSKGGSNTFHGDGYWFHQSDGYNANSWTLNAAGVKKTPFKDNREGVSIGGPIIRNKTFFFANYEKRRFPASQEVSHLVPTDTLRNGILQFVDRTGTLRQYNLATDSHCGSDNNGNPLNLPCDPRGIGISPTVQALYKLNPTGNDTTVVGSDVNNITGFRASAAAPRKNDFITFRLDHNFTERLHFFGKYLYSRSLSFPSNPQIDTLGNAVVVTGHNNLRGDGAIGALDYQISNNMSNTVRFGWIRARNAIPAISPSGSAAQLALAGTDTGSGFVALGPGLSQTGLIDVPIDVDTQRARVQGNFQRTKQFVDDFTVIKGKHTITTGLDLRWLPIRAERNDKVISSLASLVATMDADVGGSFSLPTANRPPSCSAAVTTFCLMPTDVVRWDRLYAATLGIVDNVSVLAVRDGQLQPQPFGTPLVAETTARAYDFYGQDTWRIKPTLTITYGLAYGWQTPPHEKNGKQTFVVDPTNNNQILTADGYINAKLQAAQNGSAFNPTIGYLPIRNSGRSDVYNVDYGDIAPRVSAAWSPSYSAGFLGRAFGAGKTVVRAGFGIYYDRINNVESVEIPQLGVGFAQTLTLKTPLCNANGTVSGCDPTQFNPKTGAFTNAGLAGFRVGVDGTIPVPTVPPVQSPVVPANPFGEILSFAVDPNFKVGKSYSVDFTIQRELPGNMLLEVGYIGRLGRDLSNSIDFDSSPYMLKDKTSGQTFAQAFDAVANALAAGQTVTTQPWFENQLPGLGIGCGTGKTPNISSTACLLSQDTGDFKSRFVSSLFQTIGFDRASLGLLPYNNLQVVLALFMRTHHDFSNYHAATITLRKRPTHGLQFDMNYTFSKSLDQVGTVQNNAGTYATSFNRSLQYGPSLFDRTHVFNAIFNYDLPAGNGHKFNLHYNVLNKIVDGWYVSGIFRANSGAPVPVVGGDFGGGPFANPLNLIPLIDPSSIGGGTHHAVTGSGGFGTAGNINIFSDPAKAATEFRAPLLSSDGRDGTGNPLRGLGLWNLDSRLGKTTSFHERYKIEVSADFFNIFNHVNFFDPTVNINQPAGFGVINTQLIPANRTFGSRWIQLGLRVSF